MANGPLTLSTKKKTRTIPQTTAPWERYDRHAGRRAYDTFTELIIFQKWVLGLLKSRQN